MRPPRSPLAAALLVPLLGALAAPAGAQFEVILKVGDPAPGFGAGYTVASFVEPPSMSDLRVLLHVAVDGPGADDPTAIYHWSRSGGVTRVAYTGQTVFFIGGLSRTLAFLESPISDGSTVAFTATLDVGRGLVTWLPPDAGGPSLLGVMKTGDEVVLDCDTVDGDPCPPVVGHVANVPAFTNRVAAAFDSFKVFFRATVTPNGGGSVDSLWLWDVLADQLRPIANSRQIGDGLPPAPPNFYQSFTNTAVCDSQLWGLVNVSQDAPKTVYRFQPGGSSHVLAERNWPPDALPRFDFDCAGGSWGYAGSASPTQGDTSPARRGVWQDGVQLYSNGVTPAPADLPGTLLGVPRGYSLQFGGATPFSTFAAKLVGGPASGRTGVFAKSGTAPLATVVRELQALPGGTKTIERIYTVHDAPFTDAMHVQTRTVAGGQLGEAILKLTPSGGPQVVLATGDTIDLDGQSVVVDAFRVLGRDFVDTVVLGSGRGHLTAASIGRMALVLDYTPVNAAGRPSGGPGSGVLQVDIDDLLFRDGFESSDTSRWSSATP